MKPKSLNLNTSHSIIFHHSNSQFSYNNIFSETHLSLTISPRTTEPLTKQKNNYISINKKNLKNASRNKPILNKNILKERPAIIAPSRIFEMRKEQQEKQENTKTTLHKSIDFSVTPTDTVFSKKIDQFFQTSNGRKLIHKKNDAKQTLQSKSKSSLCNYQIPTSNSIHKKLRAVNKKKFAEIFGKESFDASCSLHEGFYKPMIKFERESDSALKKKKKERIKTVEDSRKVKEKEEFYDLMVKLEAHAYDLNPNRYNFFKKEDEIIFNPERAHDSFVLGPKYDKLSLKASEFKDMDEQSMSDLENVQMVNGLFYKKMNEHKNIRLQARNRILKSPNLWNVFVNNEIETEQKHLSRLMTEVENNLPSSNSDFKILNLADDFVQNFSLKKENCVILNRQYFSKESIEQKERIFNFCENFIKLIDRSYLYGIDEVNTLNRLMRKRKPFELEDSYSFFKYFKNKEGEAIRSFFSKNKEYIYQIDHESKTCLMYAVFNNQTEIVKHIIEVGVNVDAESESGETALYFALANNNFEIASILLQNGANPWSSQKYKIGIMLLRCCEQIKLLIKNARKVHIVRSLFKKVSEKHEFWMKFRKEIQGDYVIEFNKF